MNFIQQKDHLKLFLKKDWLTKPAIDTEILSGFGLPNRQIPTSFFLHSKQALCAGYFVGYELRLSGEIIFDMCANGEWKKLVDQSADLFIIYLDLKSNRIQVVTGQTGIFPCFYTIENGNLILSTDFYSVLKTLSHPKIVIGEVLEHVLLSQSDYPHDTTIISQIKKLPPATLLTLNRNFEVRVDSLLNINTLLTEPQPFSSVPEFIDNLLETGRQVMKDHLRACSNLRFTVDISSGFDSSLVAYLLRQIYSDKLECFAMHSEFINDDTNLQVVKEICKKHSLDCHVTDVSSIYPFCTIKNTSETTGRIWDYGIEHMWKHNSVLADLRAKAFFTGHGGDELYGSYDIPESNRFLLHHAYFNISEAVRQWNLAEVLTPKALDILLDRDRFGSKNFYSTLVSPSVLAIGQLYFPSFWSGVWLLRPLADPRLIRVAQRMPLSVHKKGRQELWKNRKDIFVEGQFAPKVGLKGMVYRYLDERRDLIISILEKSILAEIGLVKARELITILKTGNTEQLKQGGIPMYLQGILQLELFLQSHNNVET